MTALIVVAAVAVLVILFLTAAIKVAREYERGVIFRLGRLLPEPKGPGVFLLIPIIDRMVKVDLRTITLNTDMTYDSFHVIPGRVPAQKPAAPRK